MKVAQTSVTAWLILALLAAPSATGLVDPPGPLAAPLAAEAQPAGKMPHVGYVFATTSSEGHQYWEATRQGLRGPGHVDGQNLARSTIQKGLQCPFRTNRDRWSQT